MGKLFTAILPEHEAFIKKQRIFFVGSAPLLEKGHVNISPKGYDTFRIISPTEVAYLDLTGSGNETSAHLKENGRITFMFTAFEGPPMILRLYGTGRVVLPGMSEWDQLIQHFDQLPGIRQIITVKVSDVKTSCGFSVPYYSFSGERDTLKKWASQKSEQDLSTYHREKNVMSMDGIITPFGQQLLDSEAKQPGGNTLTNPAEGANMMIEQKKKQPIWAWLVIILTGICLLPMGPGILVLPILPLIMAGFSTDAPGTPEYVPILVLIIGYGILIGWGLLLFFAIRSAVRANKKKFR